MNTSDDFSRTTDLLISERKTRVSITINSQLRSLIRPLTEEEKRQLERNILDEGRCRDPLVVWRKGDSRILLDGHNRLDICDKHKIPYGTVELDLPDRSAAEDWIDANQLGRRNLKLEEFKLLLGRLYNRQKWAHPNPEGTNQHTEVKGQDVTQPTTAEKLGAEHGVSARTVKRAGKYAEAVKKVASVAPEINEKVATGTAPKAATVVEAARLIDEGREDEAKETLSRKSARAKSSRTRRSRRSGKSDAMEYAQTAAKALKKIRENDHRLSEAFDLVTSWMDQQK